MKYSNTVQYIRISKFRLRFPLHRVEWFSTFLLCSKSNTFLPIRYMFRSSIPKNRQNLPRARKSFHFQKIAGTLKIYIFFENLLTSSIYVQFIKEKSPKKNSKLVFLNILFMFPKMGKCFFFIFAGFKNVFKRFLLLMILGKQSKFSEAMRQVILEFGVLQQFGTL